MASSAILAIKIVADASKAAGELNKTAEATGKWAGRMDKASKVAVGVLGGVAALGRTAYKSASELQDQAGAIDAVFGKNAPKMHAFAKSAAQSAGLAESEYSRLAAILGAQLGNLGVSQDKLGDTTNNLVQLGADLSAQFGGTSKEAVEALSSAMRGETDPIEKYGISIKQATIQAELAARGQDKLTGKALTAAKTQATLALIQKQAGSAVGAFARESGNAANQQQRAAAEAENAAAALGTVLLPAITLVSKVLGRLGQLVTEHSRAAQIAVGVITALAGAILVANGAMRAYSTAQKVAAGVSRAFAAVQTALNVVMSANPVALVVIALVALVAGLIYAYKHSEKFRKICQAVFKAVAAAVRWVIDRVKELIKSYIAAGKKVASVAKAIGRWFKKAGKWIRDYVVGAVKGVIHDVQRIVAAFQKVAKRVGALAQRAGRWIKDRIVAGARAAAAAPRRIIDALSRMASRVYQIAARAGGYIRDRIRAGIDAAARAFRRIIDAAAGFASRVYGIASRAGGYIRDKIGDAVGRARGIIDRMLAPARAVRDIAQRILDLIGRIHWPDPPGWLSKLGGIFGIAGVRAPSLSGRTAGGSSAAPAGGDTFVINIHGVTDPAAAARAVGKAVDYRATLRGQALTMRRPGYVAA